MIRSMTFVALAAIGSVAHASDTPIYAPVPDWIKPAPPSAVAPTNGEGALPLVFFDQQQRLQDGQVWEYMETVVNITSTEMLAQAGTIELEWQPGDGDLIVHKTLIVRGGEQIDLLKRATRFTVLRREAQLEELQVNGILTATMPVEGLQVGDVLRVAYSVTKTDRALQGGMETILPLVANPVRIGFARARLLWKPGNDVHFRSYMPGADAKPKDVGGYRELEVTLPLPKPVDLPADAPVRVRPLPLLEASSFTDWAAVSAVMAPLYASDGLIASGSPLAGEVDRIAKSSSDPRTRAALALQLVQDRIRYLYRGMDGGNYTPQTPAQTWTVRYGDCKAKTLLLLVLLRGLGIEAEPVLASSTMGDVLPKRLPMAAAFDHVLVRATIDGKSVWLDGTGAGARLADIDDTPGFGWVLPVRPKGAELIALVQRPEARPDITVALQIDQSAGLGLPAPYTVKVTVRGPMAGQMATTSSQLGAEKRREMLVGFLQAVIGESQPIDQALVQDADAGTVIVTATGILASGWPIDQKRRVRQLDHVVSDLRFEPDRTRPAWRDIPVATNASGSYAFHLTLRLPVGITGFELDGDQILPDSLGGVSVRRDVTLKDNVIQLNERADPIGSEVAPAEVAAVRQRLALAKTRLLRVKAPPGYPAFYQVIVAARAGGRLKPIEAAYARAIAVAEPKDALPYQNRANLRAGIFDWRGAIADLDRAITIEPTVATYLQRARLYQTLGDDAKALTDATTAYEIDSNPETIGLLTALQADTGKREVALATIDDHIAAGGKDKATYQMLKADILSRAGRGAEAVATMDAVIADNPGNSNLLNTRCWTKGINRIALETALKDCTKAIELGESATAALDSRGLVYLQLGRPEEALADIDAALDINPNLATSLYVRGVIRRRKGETAAGDGDLAAARLMRPDIDENYARYGVKP